MYDPEMIQGEIPDGDNFHELEIRKHLSRIETQKMIARKRTPREFGDFILALKMAEIIGGRFFR